MLSSKSMDEKKNLKHGHRERLRERFSSGNRLDDFELLELLLTYSIPRQDVSDLAKLILKKVGGDFTKVLDIDFEKEFGKGSYEKTKIFFRLIREFRKREKENIIKEKKDEETPKEDIIELARLDIADRSGLEHFLIFFLNNKGFMFDRTILTKGTATGTAFYPSEVARESLIRNASRVIIAHNHPSGDLKPSSADIATTNAVKKSLNAVGIALHDHLIITANGYFSFFDEGYIS